MKVLIIDDEDDIRRVARLSLVKIGGLEVVEASSGPDGLRRAAEEQPDAVLLDVMMPTTDGPQTLAALRADPATASIPVVFLTAKAMASEVERLKAMGAAGVLTKPFDPLRLPDQLREALRKAKG
jgi:CheY-like chemotaxis protein